jgi:hypothetical protein
MIIICENECGFRKTNCGLFNVYKGFIDVWHDNECTDCE